MNRSEKNILAIGLVVFVVVNLCTFFENSFTISPTTHNRPTVLRSSDFTAGALLGIWGVGGGVCGLLLL
jgi:hypothetical protein